MKLIDIATLGTQHESIKLEMIVTYGHRTNWNLACLAPSTTLKALEVEGADRLLSWLVILVCALISVQAAYADIIVRGTDASVEGDFANGFPFNGLASVRYQQVYGASEFGTVPILITGIAFRPDAGGSAFFYDLEQCSNQSVDNFRRARPNGMSGTYADNV
jgi:hypothetical protein